jgi:cellulose synthase/poly-beta-1,6-N-acetylglucosamine synthase-like glycosyltransferase
MTDSQWPAIFTLTAFGLLFYTYAGYPAMLWLASKMTPDKTARRAEPREWPTVSVIVSAYNEETVIEERIRNLLSLDYAQDRLEILIGSDGSTDRTCGIVDKYQSQGVRLFAFGERRGKASVLNDLVSRARGTIVVPTDANTFFHPDAVRELVGYLCRYPRPCTAVGRVDLHASAENGNLDGAYWRYETWIKTLESRFGGVLGANGPIYAFFRERYRSLAAEAIVDDFLVPMLMRLHRGDPIFFVPQARAWEKSPDRVRDEFRRRVRIGAGDFQALKWTWRLLLPAEGMIALAYFSHKVLRWLGPWFMLAGFAGNLLLLGDPLFNILFFGQVSFYVLGLGAALLRRVPFVGVLATAAHYFLILNAGLLLGFARLTVGLARPTWATTPRKI